MKNKKAFTLAEILITLVVIGIIAAITISIINSNIRKAELETKLKRLSATLNSAMYRTITDYGPANTWDFKDADAFMKKYLIPYLSLLKQPEEISLRELGYTKQIVKPNGDVPTSFKDLDKKASRIIFNDGTIILSTYNYKLNEDNFLFQYNIDINGSKGPNISGRDVFVMTITALEDAPMVNMYGLNNRPKITTDDSGNTIVEIKENSLSNIMNNCKSSGEYCGALIQRNGWKVPKNYPYKI